MKIKPQDRKLGWQRDLPNFQDKILKLAKPQKIPDIVDFRSKFPPIFDQLDIGSCVGEGVVAEYDYALKKQGFPFMSPSALFVYYNARANDGTVLSDNGTTIRSALKMVETLGVCPTGAWPYVTANFDDKPPASAYRLALKNKVIEARRLVSDYTISIYALTQGVPFIFGFSVFESFYSKAVAKTGLVQMPKDGEGFIGGHCCVCVGFNNITKRFLCRNSWSAEWGDKGHFTLPYEYLENRGLSDDFWLIQRVSPATLTSRRKP